MHNLLNGLHFLRPDAFAWMLGALVLASVFWFVKFQRDKRARKRYGEERLVSRFTEPLWLLGQTIVLAAWLTAIGLLFTSIAGPVLPDAPVKVRQGSLQVVVLADVSRSMATEPYRNFMPPKNGVAADVVPGSYGTSLDMAKLVIGKQIMPAIVGNQMGIAVYMGNGFNVADLTDDFSYLREAMKHLMKIGNAPGGGSDYADGLKEAMLIFEASPAPDKQKVIVWFTDGGFTGDDDSKKLLAEMQAKIREQGVRVIIIGVGSDSPIPIPTYDESTGQQTGFVQRDGKTVTTQIETQSLTDLATKMDAEYIKLEPGVDLNIAWASKLAGAKTDQHEAEVYQYPLGASMLIIFVLFLRGIIPALRRTRTR